MRVSVGRASRNACFGELMHGNCAETCVVTRFSTAGHRPAKATLLLHVKSFGRTRMDQQRRCQNARFGKDLRWECRDARLSNYVWKSQRNPWFGNVFHGQAPSRQRDTSSVRSPLEEHILTGSEGARTRVSEAWACGNAGLGRFVHGIRAETRVLAMFATAGHQPAKATLLLQKTFGKNTPRLAEVEPERTFRWGRRAENVDSAR